MASFDQAMQVVLENEGGYVNRRTDPGGETYQGISRKNFPFWAGWSTVDAAKAGPDFPAVLYRNPLLTETVREFYLQNFWNPLYHEIISQAIATKLMDTSVNEGVGTAVRLLQSSLSHLSGTPAVVDGIFGPATLDFVNGAVEKTLLLELRARCARHHHDAAVTNPALESDILGWFRRDVQ